MSEISTKDLLLLAQTMPIYDVVEVQECRIELGDDEDVDSIFVKYADIDGFDFFDPGTDPAQSFEVYDFLVKEKGSHSSAALILDADIKQKNIKLVITQAAIQLAKELKKDE